MSRIKGILFSVGLALAAVGSGIYAMQAQAAEAYKFGVVPQFEARALSAIWIPILDELSRRTGLEFEMTGSPKIPDFEASYERGEFDFAYMNPYHSLVAARTQHYEPIIRDGGRELFGILVVHKDSPISKPEDLEGKRISFPAPNALGAALLMRADLDSVFCVSFTPVYAATHTSSYLNVVLGQTEAGGGVMGTFNSQKAEIKDNLKIIYETRRMPPHPVTAHPRVPKEHVELVRKAFLEMAATEEGAAMLAKVPIKKAVAATLEDYKILNDWGLEDYYIHPN